MSKTAARDIHLFIAGALALMCFRSLIVLPFYFTTPINAVRMGGIIGLLVASLGLPIGISIIKGYSRAMLAAQAYVWFNILLGCIVVAYVWHFYPDGVKRVALKYGSDWLTNIVLLGLIFWGRVRKLKV